MSNGTQARAEARANFRRGDRIERTLYRKLRPGPGRSRIEVLSDQRARLHTATIELVAEHGFHDANVRSIARTAGVSTRTFYAHFPRAEDCFASTYRAIVRTALRRVSTPAVNSTSPDEALRNHLLSLLQTIAAEPQAAQVALLDCYDGGPAVRAEMERATLAFEHVVATSLAADEQLTPAAAGGIVAGVERVVRVRVMDGRHAELPSLIDGLTEWIATMCEPGWSEPIRLPHSPNASGNGALRIPTFDRAGDDRSRILSAVLKLAASEGYPSLTPPGIRQVASVSRRAFDASFDSVSACFLEAVEEFLSGTIRRAARRVQGRKQAVRSREVIDALAAELARSPTLIRPVFSEVTTPGQSGAVSRDRLISELAGAFSGPASPQESLPHEALAAAVWRSLSQR